MDKNNNNQAEEVKEEVVSASTEETPNPAQETHGQTEVTEESTQIADESPVVEDEENTSTEEIEEQIDAVEENKTNEEAGNADESTTEDASETADEKNEDSKDDETPKKVKDDNVPDEAKWFIVHTYAGHENKVARNLKQRVESMGFEDRIFDIIVPTRETIKVSQGRKETVQEKIFPGYVIIRMILDDESWLLVRTTQGITAFIGAGNKPTPISEKEVEAIQKFMQMDEPLYKASFSVGEAVKIVDGPFADFLGTIDDIDEARGKIKVLVSIFGRETPVELDFLQAQKL